MLKDKPVYHKVFGSGRVIAETGDTLSIHFSEGRRGVTKKFLTTALFDEDGAFPRDRNPEVWAARSKKP